MKFELAPDNRGVADEVLLEDLRQVALSLKKDYISRDEYDDLGRFHPKTLVNRFGSWSRSLELAGLRVKKYNNLKPSDCLDDLRTVAAKLNKSTITLEDYRQYGKYNERPIYRHFGNWGNALREAGLSVSSNYNERKSNEQLFQNLEAVWRAVGRQPKQSDMSMPISSIAYNTYCRRFGSWRKALEAFTAYVNDESIQDEQLIYNDNNLAETNSLPLSANATKRKTGRSVSWRLRHLVMRNDKFQCKHCGATQGNPPGTQLVIDHIICKSQALAGQSSALWF